MSQILHNHEIRWKDCTQKIALIIQSVNQSESTKVSQSQPESVRFGQTQPESARVGQSQPEPVSHT